MEKINCQAHGHRHQAFVCQHLIDGQKLGFWEPFNSISSKEYSEGELNAWCNKCDEILLEQGGEWNDKSEEFAQIQLVCDQCFFEMKKSNKKNSDFENG